MSHVVTCWILLKAHARTTTVHNHNSLIANSGHYKIHNWHEHFSDCKICAWQFAEAITILRTLKMEAHILASIH